MVFEGLQCFVRGQNSLFLDSYPSSGHLMTNLSSFSCRFWSYEKLRLSQMTQGSKKNNDNMKMVMTKINFFPHSLNSIFRCSANRV